MSSKKPVAWYVFADTEHWVTLDEEEAEDNREDGFQVRPLVFGDMTREVKQPGEGSGDVACVGMTCRNCGSENVIDASTKGGEGKICNDCGKFRFNGPTPTLTLSAAVAMNEKKLSDQSGNCVEVRDFYKGTP